VTGSSKRFVASTAAEVLTLLALVLCPTALQAEDYPYPERVRVLPVFFVPSDQDPPTRSELRAYWRHLRWAQARYELLLGGSTFELAGPPQVHRGRFPLAVYRSLEDDAAQFLSELLTAHGVNRFTCPYVFAVVLINPCENEPAGGGRPCNGGFNRGGGIVVMSSFGLRGDSPFQSTLRHELGHAFGLPHVDVYRYDMRSSRSIMSYNPLHHTEGFRPSSRPGGLIPEDRRALAANDRVFDALEFDTKRDAPGYRLRRPVRLGAMAIPDQPRFVADGASARGVGFELWRGARRVRHEPTWSRAQAVAYLRGRPRANVVARFEGVPVEPARGYELFYGAKRVGHDPLWSRAQGVENLRWNLTNKPNVQVVARDDGARLRWAPRPG
jgi:hypothetical protein